VLALRALARAKAKPKPKKGKVNSRGRLLAKLQRKLAARRAVAADAAEQAANIAGSDDLKFDAEQVEPDLVEADADERVGLDRQAPARFVAGSRHANVTTSPLLRPTGVTGTGPINAGADGAVSIEEHRALQIKLKTALAEKHHLSQQCHNSDLLIHNLLDLQPQALACGGGKEAPATYLQVAARKRPHMDVGRSPTAKTANKKLVKSPGLRGKAELRWLGENNRCYHCTEKGHRSSDCVKKSSGVPASSMPDLYSSADSAKE